MKKSIFITGHNGMVGSNLLSYFKNKYKCLTIDRKKLDLRDEDKLNFYLKKKKPDIILHAAAKAGGIVSNSDQKIEMFIENVEIQNSLFKSAYKQKIKKLIFLGSSCIYPKKSRIPINEEYLLKGKLEETNEGYALAKISGVKLCQFYNNKYNTDYRAVMPCNLYGPNDHFNLSKGHVIPALIKKFVDAKNNNKNKVFIWGTGKPLREFLFTYDLCRCLEKIIKLNKKSFVKITKKNYLINVGSEENISISQLAKKIKMITGYRGKIIYQKNFPDGVYNKKLDCNKLKKIVKKINTTKLNKGLTAVIEEYEKSIL
ncbi:NAD-dependent epimerase/dehydratase family protein [Pelagibacterales bacterium SAG-MED16]|nr:NAD-dependent epimerase/dehydratase family protein [Pelagibacterales bacterium SAG-MED16]|tara:strand:+ start:21679 stop:22623 length:945 start_codon:yes stop_codon:yes gene_type:complete